MGSSEDIERGSWGGQLEFFLSCVGYAVGLGNIWRFPYLCFRNGGGAFLIPYVISLVLVGLPVFFLELAFGQFASLGPLTIWRASPMFKGVGYASILFSYMVAIYYNVVIMYAIFYLLVSIVSFDDNVPWATCGNPWNTGACVSDGRHITSGMNDSEKLNITLSLANGTCISQKLANLGLSQDDLTYNLTKTNLTECLTKPKTPSEEYFDNYVLRLPEHGSFSDIGDVSPKLVIALLISWIIIFFVLMKGVKSSGKVIYFTATFPYIVLVILLVRGLTLEGYYAGIQYYIFPEWEQLKDPRVWTDAAGQIFYSLGPAFGSLITMASYNKFNNNCYRDAVLVALINCGTSVFAGLVIFSVLGSMAHQTGQQVKDVATDGPGLIFVAYPEGIARMPFPPIWAFMFFFMLILLGISSQMAMVEAVISALSDEFPRVLRKHKTAWVLTVCMSLFLLGIPLVTQGGIWVLTLMNDYSASYALLFTGFVELIALSWVYGLDNFNDDIKMMLGFKANIYWKLTWKFVSPVIILAVLIATGIRFTPSKYGSYEFEPWVQGIGWVMVVIPLLALFGNAFYQVWKHKGVKNACKHTSEWGPALPENRKGRYQQSEVYSVEKDNPAFSDDIELAPSGKPEQNGTHVEDKQHPPVSANGGSENTNGAESNTNF